MTALDELRVIKVKRKHGDMSMPDVLVLDKLIDTKRQKTVMRIYERIVEPEEHQENTKLPLAQIRPSPSESLLALKVQDDVDGTASVASVSVSGDEYDYYMLQDDETLLQSVDLTELCRIHLPDHDVIFLEYSCSEDDFTGSDDDSNAEDYYQNDYPDEGELSDADYDDNSDDDELGDEDGNFMYRRYASLEDLSYDEEYEYTNRNSLLYRDGPEDDD